MNTKSKEKQSRYDCNINFEICKDGIYESLISFKNLPSFKEVKKNGRKWIHTKTYAPVMDRLILDIDYENDLEKAFTITKEIMQELAEFKNCINIYFSGSKGFHIEILTQELDIVDTSAEKPMNSCYLYAEFLNYFADKYDGVDTSLKDVGTRVIRKHHSKHQKTGNYKILVNLEDSLESIILNSQADKDMLEPANTCLNYASAMNLIGTFRKPLKASNTSTLDSTDRPINADNDISIFSKVFNELIPVGTTEEKHKKIGLLGAGLNGYVTAKELELIYQELDKNTNISDSTNAKGSLFDAYHNDNIPCNLGALRNFYTDNKLDLTNFNALSQHLQDKQITKGYDNFTKKMQSYNEDIITMLDSEMYDYVDNTVNILKGVINSLSALYGYGSRFIVVNGGSEVGKSEYMNAIKKLMPNLKNLGSSTPASIRRQQEYAFDKKIVYLGDKGLKGKDDEEFKGLQEVFGGLITEGEFIRDIVVGDSVMEFNLKSDGICAFYSEPYTNLNVFGAGDQYTTRSTYVTVNPVEDGLSVFLQDKEQENPFYEIHKDYIKYILKNPLELSISKEVKTELYQVTNDSLRTAYYLLALFKAYCQYMRIGNPLLDDVDSFLEIFKPKYAITDIEYGIYEKLYRNLNTLTDDDLILKVDDDGSISVQDDMLIQIKGRKEKSFFTAKQVKTYFKSDLKRNKNLKDTIDSIPEILDNLYKADYIDKLEWQYINQNVYYLPYNAEMEH